MGQAKLQLRVSEFLLSTVLLGFARIVLAGTVISTLALILYHFNLLFGWALGLFTTAIILRFGSSAQVLAFGFILLYLSLVFWYFYAMFARVKEKVCS